MSRHSYGKCALIVAHPGHELRVHGWLEEAHPTVYVLTDGSGRMGRSRLASTTRLLEQAGARPGAIYGRHSDRALYAAVLRCDVRFFIDLAMELAESLVRERIDFVLGDADEGLILAHDLWRGVVDAAVATARVQAGRPIASYEFNLEGRPDDDSAGSGPDPTTRTIVRRLDDAALARKIAAARSYPELRHETEAALAAYGAEAFRVECLRPVLAGSEPRLATSPAYEQHGEALVAKGVYPAVVRYHQHVAPLLTALRTVQKAA